MDFQLNYGNWIRKKNLLILGSCALVIGALIFLPFNFPYRLIVSILFVIVLASFLFPLYAYFMFSQRGGKLQDKVYNMIIGRLKGQIEGRILDIGSGNGVLAVKLAQRQPRAEVVGIDYWGKDWEYSKSVCEKNASAAQVESRIHFQKGDAAALDFPSDTFDGAVSNLTFHEVKSAPDKREVLREALRVVKPGGSFAFVDYFFDAKYYGEVHDFERYLHGLNLSEAAYKPLREIMAIPIVLRHPRILGKVGIIYGQK